MGLLARAAAPRGYVFRGTGLLSQLYENSAENLSQDLGAKFFLVS